MDATDRPRPTGEALARLIRHPLRALVLFAYTEQVTSPTKIADDLREPLNVVSYHTDVLRRAGAIELVRLEPRRGAKEHFYRAVLPRDIEDAEWAELPIKLRRVLSRTVIDPAMREAADALPRGGMDSGSTHMSRDFFALDRHGRDELAALLRETVERARAIAAASRERAGDDAVPHELVIMSFDDSA
jgi:DNA-binding transcriptional ArsR family regulator